MNFKFESLLLLIALVACGPATARAGLIPIGASVTAAAGNSEAGSIDPQFGSGIGASVVSQYNSDDGQVFTITSSAFARVGDSDKQGYFTPSFHVRANATMTGDPIVRGTSTATASTTPSRYGMSDCSLTRLRWS